MSWTEEQIQAIFSQKDFARGKEYYQRGRVINLKTQETDRGELISCVVQGHEKYQVSILLSEENARIFCSCPRFADKHICKHVAAGMLAWSRVTRTGELLQSSDPDVENLLYSYLETTRRTDMCPEKARLVPRFAFHFPNRYPVISFQVGFERLYVVRDIQEFLKNVQKQNTVSYGKNLTLYHGLEQFDDLSQKLILLLMDQFPVFRSWKSRSSYIGWMSNSIDDYRGQDYQKNQITLTGSSFDRLFDLFLDRSVPCINKKQLLFSNGTPKVTVSLQKQKKSAALSIQTDGSWSFFGSHQSLYALGETRLLRCDDNFQQKIMPLLSRNQQKMRIAFSDLPLFCSCVLPAIQDVVEMQDDDQLLEEYLPDECTPCFYFDLEGDLLTMRLAFHYGDKIYNSERKIPPTVKRNVIEEEAAKYLSERYLTAEEREWNYSLSGDDAVLDFILDDMPQFHEQGEVFVTDRMRAKRLQPSSVGVGLSVSGGLLNLNIDTGGFPPEELEALYQSLLKKRRYYRLKDGRYLTLNGSDCETLAEMSHMLQLSPKDLEKGQLSMPAFRGLYLDSLLKDSDSIQVRRDQQFRAMIRNFKSVSESDFVLPEALEPVLRPYQKTGFQWLKTLASYGFGGILADEMGLGKTVQVIAFLSTLDADTPTSLVVCPASLILNWQDEFTKFAPRLNIALIMGTAVERKRIMADSDNADVWVTSYELLRQDIERYQQRKFYCCILDEGQHIKNQSTRVSKAVKQVDCQQRFILTGTPIENRLSELWNLFDFLMPGYLFSHNGFVEKLEKPIVKSGDQESMNQLRRMVQPFMLRRLKKDVLKELPPTIDYVRKISLSEEERKVYLASALATRQTLESGEQGKLAILAALTRLRQICCAPDLCFENYQGPDSKLEAVMELCSGMVENGHQILLFSQFTSMLDLIRPRLDALKISNFTLQGSTPKEKRAQLVKEFNAGAASVFLISLKAGGTGLNLTAADIVIHYDPWWNVAAQDQATGRAHRIGQIANVQVYKFIAKDTIEERILDLQTKKAELMDAVSSGSGDSILNMSKEDLLALLD